MELAVGLVWAMLVGVEWLLVIIWPFVWPLWEGVVVTDGVVGVLGNLCWGRAPGPIVEALSILLILEAEVLPFVTTKGDGEVGGDGLSSPWAGGSGRGGGVGPGSGIM